MFDGSDYPKPLEEDQFERWLEKGRESKISYQFLLVIWDEFEKKYAPTYAEDRKDIIEYEVFGFSVNQESLVAVYDLYSEARLSISTFQ